MKKDIGQLRVCLSAVFWCQAGRVSVGSTTDDSQSMELLMRFR